MTTLIGLAPGERGGEALHLGEMIARSRGVDVVVTTVVPAPWPPSPYRGDVEYLALQEQAAQVVLDEARSRLGGDLRVRYVLQKDRSVASGLLNVAAAHGASQVVLGSSGTGGYGRVTLGGIANRLLHSTETPLALAPSGFTAGPGARVERLTVAFGRGDGGTGLLDNASAVAEQIGATLRVVCFAVRPVNVFSAPLQAGADRLIAQEWRRGLDREIEQALPGGAGGLAVRPDTVLAQGDSWPAALADVAWAPGDVLVIGTSTSAVSRFVLGSHATKIVRSSPVPVVLSPRSTPDS